MQGKFVRGRTGVSLEQSFAELAACLRKLHEVLSAARLTIVEDQPSQRSAVADAFGSRIEDALGNAHDALEYAGAASNAIAEPLDFNRARTSLGKSQKAFHCLERCYFPGLVSCEKLAELESFVSRAGPEWQAWARCVKVALDECSGAIAAANLAFINCWEDLAEALTLALAGRPESPPHEA